MANANIKISQLPNIGGNLNGNTLLPVVSTNGTFITDKVTLSTLANYILDQAGNSLHEAFVANIAYSVANSAQPNITSIGNLTGLTITNLGNLHIPGGTNGYVLQTDGNSNLNWTAMAGSGNGNPGGSNTQIQFNDEGLFGGNPGLVFDKDTDTLGTVNILASNATIYDALTVTDLNSTGNLTANNANISNLSISSLTSTGNISAPYFIGNGSALTGITAVASAGGPNTSVQFNNSGAISGNANFTYDVGNNILNVIRANASYLTAYDSIDGGNLVFANNIQANYLSGDGSNITNVSANYSEYANISNVANSVAVANVDGIGNIATLNLDGNSSNILFGNGVFAAAPTGGGLPIANGNSEINIPTADQNIELTVNGTRTFEFGQGYLDVPKYGVYEEYGRIRGNGLQLRGDTNGGGSYAAIIIPNNDDSVGNALTVGSEQGNILLWSNAQSWTFDINGNLTLPGNGIIGNPANSSLDPLNPNVSTMVLTPDQNYSYQSLVLDPTAPGHIHLRGPSYSGNIDEPAANLFLGGELSSFEVGASYGIAPNLFVHAGGQNWTFDTTGNLTAPGSLLPDADISYDLGNSISRWRDLYLSNSTIYLGNASISANGNSIITSAINTGNMTIGSMPGLIQGDSNTVINIVANGVNSGYLVNYYSDYSNANTQFGELALNSITSNASYQISLSNDVGNNSNIKNWTFDTKGNLTFPDATVQPTAWTGNVDGANVIGEVANANYASYVNVASTSNNYSYHIVLVKEPGESQIELDADNQLQYNPGLGLLTTYRLDADLVVANLNYSNGYQASNIVGLGNVGLTNFDGNSGNVLYGNGVFAPSTGGASGASGFSGYSGYSGYSGEIGTSGYSGYSGNNGAEGSSGYSGYSGSNGPTGDSGYSGYSGSGISGYSGYSGEAGPSGYSGYSGEIGTSGYSGESGYSGLPGDKYSTTSSTSLTIGTGSQTLTIGTGLAYSASQSVIIAYDSTDYMNGTVTSYNKNTGEFIVEVDSVVGSGTYISWDVNLAGAVGQQGDSGYSGYSGEPGPSGYSGYSGEAGASGYSGDSGISGYSGYSGSEGPAGTSGYSGYSGSNGSTGISGYSGYSGANGSAGDSGYSGYSGAIGSQGVSGYSGYSGLTGPIGGSNTEVIFNDTGTANGSANLTFNKTTNILDVNGSLLAGPGNPLGGLTNPIVASLGNTDNFIQTYIFNSANTANASSDFVAYPNNGLDTTGWIDVGITSNAFSQAAYSITTQNEGYVFMSSPATSGRSGNLVIATDSTGANNSIEFYVGGFSQTKNGSTRRLLLDTSNATVTGNLTVSGNANINGGVLNTSASTANLFNVTSTTVNIGGAASLNVNIGNASGKVNLSGNVQGNTNGFAIGYRDIPQLSLSANTTVALTDAGKHYYSTSSSNLTLTIANNSTVTFSTGATINIINQGTGNITVAQGTGVTIYMAGNSTSGNRVLSSYGVASITKVATDTWFISGVGLV